MVDRGAVDEHINKPLIKFVETWPSTTNSSIFVSVKGEIRAVVIAVIRSFLKTFKTFGTSSYNHRQLTIGQKRLG